MMRVLITGAAGFIGRQVVGALGGQGVEVHGVSRRPDAAETGPAVWHRVDLMQPAEVEELLGAVRPSHLVHLAWYAEPGAFWSSVENLRWVESSLRLLRAFRACGGERAVFAGSCAEYDWRHGFLSENVTPLEPATFYGMCKNALHELVRGYCAETGLSYAWGRVFFAYGPHEHRQRLVADVTRSLLQGEPARCSTGEQMRDFLHVHDVGRALASLALSELQGPVNIASGVPQSVRAVVVRIADLLNASSLLELGAGPQAQVDAPLVLGDVRRLRNELGWTPRYDLDAGLSQTLEWWREQLGDAASVEA